MVSRWMWFLGILLLATNVAAQSGSIKISAKAESGNKKVESTEEPAKQVIDAPISVQERLNRGHKLYAEQDFKGALSEYEQAKTDTPGAAIVYYFIGCAQARLAKYEDAILTFKTVSTLAGGRNNSLMGKAMFWLASIEEMRRQYDASVEGWKAYQGFAQTHQDAVTFPKTADARIEAINNTKALDESYRVVRERIQGAK